MEKKEGYSIKMCTLVNHSRRRKKKFYLELQKNEAMQISDFIGNDEVSFR